MKKSDNSYKTIGEVAEILNLKNKKKGTLSTHTIRFWEKEFSQVEPIILMLMGTQMVFLNLLTVPIKLS